MEVFGDPARWLPLVFAGLMGLSILIYVILDGFDLGIGALFPFASDEEKDRMIAAIGPFWDANETWLVLAIGLLLVAFPAAHGVILTSLYLPVAVMLIGLILRGVAFEFRAKTSGAEKRRWNFAFYAGSSITTLAQGYMLGFYIMGLQSSVAHHAFAILTALCLSAGYGFIGASWLVIKTDGELQRKAVGWARLGLIGVVAGFLAISIASPMVSTRIFEKWFSVPEILLLGLLPLASAVLVASVWIALRHLPTRDDSFRWLPFLGGSGLFTLAFAGLAYSFYPYVVPEKLTIYDAASAPESLWIILIGAVFVLPSIIGYTIIAYTVFRGKATTLSYD